MDHMNRTEVIIDWIPPPIRRAGMTGWVALHRARTYLYGFFILTNGFVFVIISVV